MLSTKKGIGNSIPKLLLPIFHFKVSSFVRCYLISVSKVEVNVLVCMKRWKIVFFGRKLCQYPLYVILFHALMTLFWIFFVCLDLLLVLSFNDPIYGAERFSIRLNVERWMEGCFKVFKDDWELDWFWRFGNVKVEVEFDGPGILNVILAGSSNMEGLNQNFLNQTF